MAEIDRHVARLRDVVHARLAGEHGRAVHAHPARAADHHAAALAVRERPVVAVLDDVEHVEQRRPLRRVDLVLAQRALARLRVDAPDLDRDLHQPTPAGAVTSTTVAAVGGLDVHRRAEVGELHRQQSTCARIACRWSYALVV